MAMTKTRYRRQSTLTFLVEQLVTVERELELLRRKAADGTAADAGAERLRSLEARRLALVEAMRQFDPGLDAGAIAGVAGSEGVAGPAAAIGGGHG